MASSKSILAEALQLTPEERAEVARELIASLDSVEGEGTEAAWLLEVERRLERVEQGAAKLVPWDAVREELSARLRAVGG